MILNIWQISPTVNLIQLFIFFLFFFRFIFKKIASKPVSNTLTPTKTSVTTESSAVSTLNLQQQQQQLIAKKRNAQVLGTDVDSITSYKKRTISFRINRLKQIKENHAEQVAEIYFLQTGGNMMDYPTWRKKPTTTEFVNFTKQYLLEPLSADTSSTCGVTSTTTLSTVTASPTVQTVGQQSHSQNATQPPPLISTNSPHGKPNHNDHYSHFILYLRKFLYFVCPSGRGIYLVSRMYSFVFQ